MTCKSSVVEPSSLFVTLVFITLLILFLRFSSTAMSIGSKEGESCVSFPSFGSSCLSPLYACTHSRPQHSLGSSGDNRTAKTHGVSGAIQCAWVEVPYEWTWVLVFFGVSAPSDAASFPWCEDWKKQTTIPLLLLLFHPLFGSRHLPWHTDRERSGLLPFPLSLLYSIPSLTMMIGSKTRLSLQCRVLRTM